MDVASITPRGPDPSGLKLRLLHHLLLITWECLSSSFYDLMGVEHGSCVLNLVETLLHQYLGVPRLWGFGL